MDEIWKDIEGYEGLYQVSNLGRVKGSDKEYQYEMNGVLRMVHRKEHIMKPQKYKNRNKIQLHDANGVIRTYRVATLVANAFIPNPDNKPEIDHIIPVCMGGTDAADNLRWVTSEENSQNPLSRKYNSNRQKKEIIQYSISGEFIKNWSSAKDAGEELDISRMRIGEVCRGKRKTAGGFIWRFAS